MLSFCTLLGKRAVHMDNITPHFIRKGIRISCWLSRWSHVSQTWQAGSHQEWLPTAFGVIDVEGLHVLEGIFIDTGYQEYEKIQLATAKLVH